MSKNKNEQKQKAPVKSADEFSLKEYVYLNLMFWAFLAVVGVIVFFTTGAKWDPVMGNVFAFLFLVFGLGFTCVSVFDAIYDRAAKGTADEK
jgi:Na+/H+ antiporter NhaC